MHSLKSSCPVVERTEETFVEFISVGGERRRVEFSKPIIWLQETESKIVYLHGGNVLKEGATHTDWYGYLTSHKELKDHANDLLGYYGITPDSSLELIIETTVFQRPVTENAETIAENRAKPSNYKSNYLYVPDTWRKEAVEDGETIYPMMQHRILHKGAVWSSKHTPESNHQLEEAFKAQWAVQQTADKQQEPK